VRLQFAVFLALSLILVPANSEAKAKLRTYKYKNIVLETDRVSKEAKLIAARLSNGLQVVEEFLGVSCNKRNAQLLIFNRPKDLKRLTRKKFNITLQGFAYHHAVKPGERRIYGSWKKLESNELLLHELVHLTLRQHIESPPIAFNEGLGDFIQRSTWSQKNVFFPSNEEQMGRRLRAYKNLAPPTWRELCFLSQHNWRLDEEKWYLTGGTTVGILFRLDPKLIQRMVRCLSATGTLSENGTKLVKFLEDNVDRGDFERQWRELVDPSLKNQSSYGLWLLFPGAVLLLLVFMIRKASKASENSES
jgi:hypothetical protein